VFISFLISSLCVVAELDDVFNKFMGLLKSEVDSTVMTILGRFSVCRLSSIQTVFKNFRILFSYCAFWCQFQTTLLLRFNADFLSIYYEIKFLQWGIIVDHCDDLYADTC